MKKILFFLFLNLNYLAFSQVGLGTTTPRGDLDINNPITNTFGLVLPTNTSSTEMQNPQGGAIAFGTVMYDNTANCIRYYEKSIENNNVEKWSNCLLTDRENPPSIDYIPMDPAFTGTYTQNVAMTSANTFRVAVTNTSFTPITLNFSRTDLILSGVEGIEVSGVSPTRVTLNPGQVQLLTYTLTGTPTDCGTLTGTWRKINLTHTANTTVKPNITYACTLGTWNNSVTPEYRLTGLVPGESYTGTYTIPYTNAGTCDLAPEVLTHKGLTLTFNGGPISPTGVITYTLSGTYTGSANSGWAVFTTATGCQITLGPCGSCKEILEVLPGTPSGVYKIDIDKQGTTYGLLNAQCDMTTDGGGWTMMANYAVSYDVQPIAMSETLPTNSFNNKFPLIGTETLGVNEVGNTTSFGSAGSLLAGFAQAPTEWRVWGIRSNNNTTTIAATAHWKAPLTAAIRTSIINNQAITNSTTPTQLQWSTVAPTVWGNACCSAWGGRRSAANSTGFDNYGFWQGYLQIHRTNDGANRNATRDNSIYRVWVR